MEAAQTDSWDLANKGKIGKIFGLETGSKIIIENILHFAHLILMLSAMTTITIILVRFQWVVDTNTNSYITVMVQPVGVQ